MATLIEALPFKRRSLESGLTVMSEAIRPAGLPNVFERARKESFVSTLHCDVNQENNIEPSQQAIEDVKADRIDHGTNMIGDPRLIDMISRKGTGLTCCLVTNSGLQWL